VTHALWARAGGLAAAGWGDSNSGRLLKHCLVAASLPAGLRFLTTGGARWCPLHSPTCRLRVYPVCTAGFRSRLVWAST
jgi:hypothetical protein